MSIAGLHAALNSLVFIYRERGSKRVKCLVQEHNIMTPGPGLELRSLKPETREVNMRPPLLHKKN